MTRVSLEPSLERKGPNLTDMELNQPDLVLQLLKERLIMLDPKEKKPDGLS